MSSTVAAVERNVRLLLGDTDTRDYVIRTDALRQMIVAASVELTGEELPGSDWVTGWITTTAGNPDKALTAGVHYQAILLLRNQTYETLVHPIPNDELELLRHGGDGTGGPPIWFAVRETAANTLTLRFWPTPDQAYVLDALVSSGPAQTVTDATVIPWGNAMVRGAEYMIAAQCLASMMPEDAARLHKNAAVVPLWMDRANRLIRAETLRKQRLSRPSHIPPAVY